jgi:uncharacterized DUF497 family protein
VRIDDLIIDADRVEHIARHHVTAAEAEQVVFGNSVIRRSTEGRYRMIGQTDAGRYLCVIVAPRGGGVFGLVTARDASDAERRAYRSQERR